MKSTIQEIFDKLLEKKQLSISVSSRAEYDNLRSRLCRMFSAHKSLMDSIGGDTDSSGLSLSGEYTVGQTFAKFFIRQRKTAFGRISFQILDEDSDATSIA